MLLCFYQKRDVFLGFDKVVFNKRPVGHFYSSDFRLDKSGIITSCFIYLFNYYVKLSVVKSLPAVLDPLILPSSKNDLFFCFWESHCLQHAAQWVLGVRLHTYYLLQDVCIGPVLCLDYYPSFRITLKHDARLMRPSIMTNSLNVLYNMFMLLTESKPKI